jgi:hypothetical protein
VADTKKKGGRRGSFYDRYRLPAEPAPEAAIVLIRGDYIDATPAPEQIELDPATGRPKEVHNPYYKMRKHKHALKKNGVDWYLDEICSAGSDPHNPQPCVGCYAMDSGNKAVGVNEFFALGMIHLAYYHGHPLLDDHGQITMKKDKPGEQVTIYDECTGRTCNYCKVIAGQPPIASQQDPWPGYPQQTLSTIFGRRRYLELGKGHLSDISGIDAVIGSMCGNCGNQLTTDGFICPTCNSMIIDMGADPRTDEQIAAEVCKPYPCMKCQRAVMAQEIVSCEVCERQNQKGVQLTLFDVVLQARRQGEGTKSHVTRSNHFTIEQFAQRIDPAWLQGKTLRQYIVDLAGQPYDFAEMFAPRSLQDQSKRLELPMPPSAPGTQAQPQYAQYATPQAQQVYGAQQAQPGFQQPPPQMAPAAPQQPGPQPVTQMPPPYFGTNR